MKLNLGAGAHLLDGFENLDRPWRMEDGLPYPDGSVEAITISCALMYVPIGAWPAVFAEFARVLEPGGFLRITEEDNENPKSRRFGGRRSDTRVWPQRVIDHAEAAGLTAAKVTPRRTAFRDKSLIQEHHGKPPTVFHVEAVKP